MFYIMTDTPQIPGGFYIPLTEQEIPNLINVFDGLLQQSEFRKKTSHYPSSARVVTPEGVVGACLRQQYYYWMNEDVIDFDVSSLWKMEIGNAIHEWVYKKLRDTFQVYPEYVVEYKPSFLKYPVRGRIDNLVVSEQFGSFGIEVKSGYGAGFTNRISGIKHAGPKPNHLLQALIYLYISKLPEELKNENMPLSEEDFRPIPLPELNFFILYYLARDNAYRTQFYLNIFPSEVILDFAGYYLPEHRIESLKKTNYVPIATDGVNLFIYEHVSFKNILMSYLECERYLEKNSPPPRDFNATFDYSSSTDTHILNRQGSDWNCSYCNFANKCWIEDKDL